jgi:archaeal flagellar protein FlaI
MFKTKADLLIELLEARQSASVDELAKLLDVSKDVIVAFAQYLEDAGIINVKYSPMPVLVFVKAPETGFEFTDEKELIKKINIMLEVNNIKGVNSLLYELYTVSKKTQDERLLAMYNKAYEFFYNYLKQMKLVDVSPEDKKLPSKELIKEIDNYKISADKFLMPVKIVKQEFELVPYYILSLLEYGKVTEVVLDRVKDEIVKTIKIRGFKRDESEEAQIQSEFGSKLSTRLLFLFPEIPEAKINALTEYIKITTLGFGEVEVLLKDPELEEIVINNANEPVWVYHKKFAWLKTNVILKNEETIKHYATLAGRVVNKDITLLNPLLDAHLKTGDRVNATLGPISTKGNTITIRKFATKPWTVTNLIKNKTLDYNTAALIWFGVQYELSVLIVGGTGSGKTSTLNVISNFFPPNQRVISIEDTRELILPETLHWVPLQTRLANPEGKGELSMLDLLVNSLRMRPDRIIVGEIRRKAEAEVLFEAMRTGHSVYATLHANSVDEAMIRLTTPPIDIPKTVLNSLSLLIVQNRNRRTGLRRTFQVAEALETGDFNILYELDVSKDEIKEVSQPKRLYKTLKLFSGLNEVQIKNDMKEKIKLLKYLVEKNIDDVHEIGSIVSDYYSNSEYVFKRLFPKEQQQK